MSSINETEGYGMFRTSMSAAVPLWIVKIKDTPWSELQQWMKENGEVISFESDCLFNGRGAPGQVAKVFNALAKGIAILSYCPGGVRPFGMEFDARVILNAFRQTSTLLADDVIPVNIAAFHKGAAKRFGRIFK